MAPRPVRTDDVDPLEQPLPSGDADRRPVLERPSHLGLVAAGDPHAVAGGRAVLRTSAVATAPPAPCTSTVAPGLTSALEEEHAVCREPGRGEAGRVLPFSRQALGFGHQVCGGHYDLLRKRAVVQARRARVRWGRGSRRPAGPRWDGRRVHDDLVAVLVDAGCLRRGGSSGAGVAGRPTPISEKTSWWFRPAVLRVTTLQPGLGWRSGCSPSRDRRAGRPWTGWRRRHGHPPNLGPRAVTRPPGAPLPWRPRGGLTARGHAKRAANPCNALPGLNNPAYFFAHEREPMRCAGGGGSRGRVCSTTRRFGQRSGAGRAHRPETYFLAGPLPGSAHFGEPGRRSGALAAEGVVAAVVAGVRVFGGSS